jgi:FKBP-type peptidyl-prolyl cis-trans isomerase
MMRVRRIAIPLVVPLLLAGCGPADERRPPEPPELPAALEVPRDSLLPTPEGIWQYDREVGQGAAAAPGDRVSVHYTGWLTSGARFDGTRGDRPFTFRLGAGEVISGWDIGVVGMRPGGRRVLVIPPRLAYGERGVGVLIPPHAELVFEIQLLAAENLE